MNRIGLSTITSSTEVLSRNRRKPAKDCHDETCLLCNSPIDSSKAVYVHLSTHGELVSKTEVLTEAEDQGFHPVGRECAKRVPSEFRHKQP